MRKYFLLIALAVVTLAIPSSSHAQTTPVGPTGSTFCAAEGAQCVFTGTQNVAYGANGAFFFKMLTGGSLCANSVFGDPVSGTAKSCYVMPGSHSVTLSWGIPASGTVNSYNIKRGAGSGLEALLVNVDGLTFTYIDTAVTEGSTYYYVVTAIGPGGESLPSNEVFGTIPRPLPPAPGAPPNLSAVVK